ncbi:Wadjet anti-phage system protein JetD domain-containing protein [Brachybacterium vulturis]|uniref:Wadjet anti-phage system protein JetD domain-containing protein n=1 Tax=Brachybacterium vulturis TaxID=2017484 RepID=UPI00373658F2
MRGPDHVQGVIRRRWDRSVPQWLATPTEARLALPLHPPTSSQALAEPAAVAAWIEAWHTAPVVLREHAVWEERRWAQLGTQRIPVRWEATGAETLLRGAGDAAQREAALLSARFEAAVALLTQHSELAPDAARHAVASAVDRFRVQWLRMSDADAELSIHVADWLLQHPDSGLRIRQIPFPGMHTKWLRDRRALVSRLVGAVRADGSVELGLAPAPVFHDLLILDPGYRPASTGPAFPRASRIALADLPGIPLSPEVVIVCENAETVQVLPDIPGSVALSGSGYGIAELLAVPWVRSVPVVYWGDIDADGFRILDRARHHHPRVSSVLMDDTTLETHRELVVPSPPRPPAALTGLSPAELALHDALSVSGDRLEQERIELRYAVAALRTGVGSIHAVTSD